MEKENESKIKELEKCIKNQSKDIKRLKKKQGRKMIRIKFVGVIFDPNKFKNGETEVNDALSDGFEVIRDFETAGGIVMALGKWEKNDEKVNRMTHPRRQEEGGKDLGNDGQLGAGYGKQTNGAEQRENDRQQG